MRGFIICSGDRYQHFGGTSTFARKILSDEEENVKIEEAISEFFYY
jgi:hypothetical protein